MCTRETVYVAFNDPGDEDHGPSKITHQDTLPIETCCAWAKKLRKEPDHDAATQATIRELEDACPEPVTTTTLHWNTDAKTCVETTSNFEEGEF